MSTDSISFTSPAKDWNEALPIGNGKNGAMVYGGVYTDILQLNNDSVWYGRPKDRLNPDARENLPKIRDLIKEGRVSEAEDLCALALSGIPDTMSHYEPLGNLYILHDIDPEAKISGYRRELSYRPDWRKGNDKLQGDHDDDTYIFDKGYGADTVYDAGGNNTIVIVVPS